MRFMIFCLSAALAVSTIPTPLIAAESAEKIAASPTARRTELARRYLDLMMTDQFGSVIREMLGDEFDNDSEMQGVPDADRRFILNLTAELTTELVPLMITEMIPIYAATFSEEELGALVVFYDTPLGRSIATKSVEVMPEANRAIMAVVPQMLEKMATRMCQHYGCTPAEEQEMRRTMRESAGLAPATPVRSK
jgi:uncharacterized protein